MTARGQHTEEPGAGGRGGAGRVLLSAERMPSTHSSCGMARREARFGSEDSAPTRTPAAAPPPLPSAISAPPPAAASRGIGLAVGPSLPWSY